MKRVGRGAKLLSVVLVGFQTMLFSATAAAQAIDLSPEFDLHVHVTPNARIWLQADRTREAGSLIQTEIGPSLELSLKPLVRLEQLTERQPDKLKARLVSVTIGYRYLDNADKPSESRIVFEATPRYPFLWKLLVSDRSRWELRFIAGNYSWRYRNRLTVEREFSADSYSFTSYVRAEAYYDSNYNKWNATALIAGLVFPFKKYFELEPNFQHMNQTGGTSNQQVETFGLTLSLYF